MKKKLKIIFVLVLVVTASLTTLFFTNQKKGSANLTSLHKVTEYDLKNEIVPVYYGEELKEEIKSKGDLIVYEEDNSREYIYDQSSWKWMPIVKGKKKSVIVNRLTMNTKLIVDAKSLEIVVKEDEKKIEFLIVLEKEDLIKDIKKDVDKSGINWDKTEKGSWGENLPTEITEKDEKSYREELEQEEISEHQYQSAKENLIKSIETLLEKQNTEKELIIK